MVVLPKKISFSEVFLDFFGNIILQIFEVFKELALRPILSQSHNVRGSVCLSVYFPFPCNFFSRHMIKSRPLIFCLLMGFYIKLLKFGQESSSIGQLRNWALCKQSFEPYLINSPKKKKLAMRKVQIYNKHRKLFSDTAQYFHSKHLKN